MAITAKELAKLLGLSEAAVSLALNRKPGVSTATRKKVIEAAKEYGYDFSKLHPAEIHKNGSISYVIYKKHGAVVSDTSFFNHLMEGIKDAAQLLPYYLNICCIYEGEDIPSLLDAWLHTGCRGIVLLGTEMKFKDMGPFLNAGIPMVLLDNYFEEIAVDSVLINNIQGAYSAANYLIRKRRLQPGYLHSSYSISNFEERADGFYKAIRNNGMSASRSIVHRLSPSVDGAYADMKELLLQNEPLASCYFADNDLIAAGACRAFKEAGYEIPRDIAIVGFDDMPLCVCHEPPLTTINVPKRYMGQMAVNRLYEIINRESNPIKIEISTTMQYRQSC